MGIKLFKRKKNKQTSIDNDGSDAKTFNTPSKVGTNATVITPDTVPGSPIPQQDMTELLEPASTPNTTSMSRPSPTSFNQRMMESETPLVSNVASNPQLGRNNSSGAPPHLTNTPQQAKSNQIRDEIGQYYEESDRGDTRVMMATNNNNTNKKEPVTKTFAQPSVGVKAFSMDESEEVEVQLSPGVQMQGTSPVRGPTSIASKRSKTSSRAMPPSFPKFVSKINQDEVSVPSLITEPDGNMSVRGLAVVKENEALNGTQQEPESAWSKISLQKKVIDGVQSIDDGIKSMFTADIPPQGNAFTSAATQAGGIEQLLGFLQCNEDTTCGPVDVLCGPTMTEKDMVDLENDQEQQFAMKFNSVSVFYSRESCLPLLYYYHCWPSTCVSALSSVRPLNIVYYSSVTTAGNHSGWCQTNLS